MATCDLCDLSTPDPPVTASGVEGRFCCRGCLEVSRSLDDVSAGTGAETDRGTAGPGEDRPAHASGETAFLAVDGMHCATCEAYLESRALGHEGVLDASASYPAGLVRVVHDPDAIEREALADLLDGPGYDARPADLDGSGGGDGSLGRLLVGGGFGMMVMVWYVLFLYPAYLGVSPASLPVDLSGAAGTYLLWTIWVMATVVLGYAGYPRLRGAYVSLRAGVPNMDLLVALAVVSAYAYSTAALLAGSTEVYFDVVVAVVVVVALGKHYESRVTRRAAGHLADLATARAETARRRTADGVETVAVEDVGAGDAVVVRPGERVPLDGTVASGTASVDEALLTGVARPRSVGPGEAVVGGSTVVDGSVVVEVAGDGGSRVDRLLAHLWAVQSRRRGTQRLADRLSAALVPAAIVLAVAGFGWRLLAGAGPRAALLGGLSVLVVSCPCALGLATPLAVARGVHEALAAGVVVTDGSVFERAAAVDVVALDKTGTLTTGEMTLVDVVGEEGVLERAAAVETRSSHPVADAVVAAAEERGLAPGTGEVRGFERHAGRGVGAVVDGEPVLVGSRELVAEHAGRIPDRLDERAGRARDRGHLPAFVAVGDEVAGLLVAGDRLRPGWAAVVADLAREREVVVLTGDDGVEPGLASHPGISTVFAGLPPEAKAEAIGRLRGRGTVAMVGDGTNDAAALAAADVGVAIERGAALAADAADAVVTTDDLDPLPAVFELTAATRRRVRWNVAWALGYNATAIPAALLGLLNPLVAAAAMAASSLLVVGNSARRLRGEGAAGGEPPAAGSAEPAD